MRRLIVLTGFTTVLAGCLFPSFSNLNGTDQSASTASVVDGADAAAPIDAAVATTTATEPAAAKASWRCGPDTCETGFCCLGIAYAKCQAPGASSFGCGFTSVCDDATDCGPGAACCLTGTGDDDDDDDGKARAVCKKGGCGKHSVVCRTDHDEDCPTGKSCGFGGGLDVSTCR